MTDSERLKFVCEVLALSDDYPENWGDLFDSLHWRCDGEFAPVTFFVNCNDLFWWATADGEDLQPGDLKDLKQAVMDVRKALDAPECPKRGDPNWNAKWDEWYKSGSTGATLWCARKRGMRPQRPCYKHFDERLHPLFDACGPERDPKSEG